MNLNKQSKAFFLVAFLSLSVHAALARDAALVLPTDPAPLVAETSEGRREITIEIADDDRERAAGLMFRKEMADQHGMLFVMDASAPVGFWMHNTPMPLDLVFIGRDGRVKRVMKGEPYSDATIAPGMPVRFVLELKRGMAAKLGIKDGARLEHPAIAKAAADGR
ncbi:DUF192 domain-containing protein [Mesorhizobium sp. RP14(2022)]|uniref:DUF192 domain-containing protein n=1 Tax=Mesorhizobium liriopis TaxID=2953882 RepID=A0ABT1CB83_9HYPH|nr:DUF192 domain-containing protein [Mesorhizobium liriopis]MCO6052079.1 DUF192 domain-containing protein [Mesorhizobium liriopis]